MAKPTLNFWFDFASTYSYPAAMRIASLAATSGITVRWRPFLLGPIFKAQGWATSPFNLYPSQGPQHVARPGACMRHARSSVFKRPDPHFRKTPCWQREPRWSRLQISGVKVIAAPSICAEFGEGRNIEKLGERSEEILKKSRTGCRPPCSSRPSRLTSNCSFASKPTKHSGSAYSAHRVSSPPAASCSGATTALEAGAGLGQALAFAPLAPAACVAAGDQPICQPAKDSRRRPPIARHWPPASHRSCFLAALKCRTRNRTQAQPAHRRRRSRGNCACAPLPRLRSPPVRPAILHTATDMAGGKKRDEKEDHAFNRVGIHCSPSRAERCRSQA